MEGYVIILIAVGVAVTTAIAGAATDIRYWRLAATGIVAGLLLWLAMGIVIFRGPDNPDLGEAGWTIVVGVVIAIWVGAWVIGAGVGRLLRGARRGGQQDGRLSSPS